MQKLLIFGIIFVCYGCDREPVFVPARWITIPAGSFNMGSPSTESCREPYKIPETLHKVTLTQSFEISDTETTQGQFEERMLYNPSHTDSKKCGPDCPADKVSWHEAVDYCNSLSREQALSECFTCSGKESNTECTPRPAYRGTAIYDCPGFRLPTEAEWEYAARANTGTAYYNGVAVLCKGQDPNASKIAWYSHTSGGTIHLSGTKEANAWEVYDMSGSVWEWTNDWYQPDLGSDAATDPVGPSAGLGRMFRGGSVVVAAELVRSASRHNYSPPKEKLKHQGFRCVRTVR